MPLSRLANKEGRGHLPTYATVLQASKKNGNPHRSRYALVLVLRLRLLPRPFSLERPIVVIPFLRCASLGVALIGKTYREDLVVRFEKSANRNALPTLPPLRTCCYPADKCPIGGWLTCS